MLECLETRTVPARFNIPWPDPTHLTLSFAPDGTAVAGQPSNLFQILNGQEPTSQWQGAILRALQTWVVQANLNVGVVTDNGQPLGTSGPGEGYQAFGEIRISAVPMSSDVLAISVPYDRSMARGWSGAVILNSTYNFTCPSSDLYSVMLHEFGNLLGIPDSNDPSSVMYVSATQPRQQLAASDVAALQALYGVRPAGAVTTLVNPQGMPYPAGAQAYTGQTPLVQYGNLASPGNSAVFAVSTLPSYQGAMTFRLQTAGISLLEPQLTVYDAAGHVLGNVASYQLIGDTITVTVPKVNPAAVYYAKVAGATGNMFGTGQFALAVTFDAQLLTPPTVIDMVIRGQNDSLNPTQLDQVFHDAALATQSDDGGDHLGPVNGQPSTPGDGSENDHESIGSLANIAHAAYYRLASPDSGDSGDDTLPPSGGNPTAGDWTGRHDPSRTDQVPRSGGDGEDGSDQGGPTPQTSLTAIIGGTLTPSAPQQGGLLLLDQSQLVHFVLSTDPITAGSSTTAFSTAPPSTAPPSPPAPIVAVEMIVTDSSGNVLLDATAQVGNTANGGGVLLSPGAYTITFKAVSSNGVLPASLVYHLQGASISDPIGPGLKNPTLAPTPVWPVNPSQAASIVTQLLTNPFYWLTNVV
jgi:hypothetical protein